MRDFSDENRGISYGEMAHIQGLNDNELQELEDECYEAKEEKETMLIEDYLTEISFEKERRGL